MEEIQRYADLLDLLDAGRAGGNSQTLLSPASSAEEDSEVLEWAALVAKASPGLMQKTRLRICTAGLLAVHRHITSHPHSD